MKIKKRAWQYIPYNTVFGCRVYEYPRRFFEACCAWDEEEWFICFGCVAFFEVDAGDAGEVDAAEEVYVDGFVGWFLLRWMVRLTALSEIESWTWKWEKYVMLKWDQRRTFLTPSKSKPFSNQSPASRIPALAIAISTLPCFFNAVSNRFSTES